MEMLRKRTIQTLEYSREIDPGVDGVLTASSSLVSEREKLLPSVSKGVFRVVSRIKEDKESDESKQDSSRRECASQAGNGFFYTGSGDSRCGGNANSTKEVEAAYLRVEGKKKSQDYVPPNNRVKKEEADHLSRGRRPPTRQVPGGGLCDPE